MDDSAQTITTESGRHDAQAELVRALTDGPGIVVFTDAFPDLSVLDRATAAFDELIAEQRASGVTAGDHFAKPGANDRVWNALEKLAVRAPEVFADYYANDILALISNAWLGPAYQVTSQVNVVNPGGTAQSPHRDYHLGFMTNEQAARFPAHVHALSPVLTLQGAVAHSDMPVVSGPTMYLPYSQKYAPGYLAWRRPEFIAYFDQHLVQLPLAKGDAAFFNPALFHGAGTTVRPTSSGWRTSCRCRRHSAGRWRASTVRRSPTPSTRHCSPGDRRGWIRRRCATRWPREPRATRSPRTSTATSRSTDWPRAPRLSLSCRRSMRSGQPATLADALAGYSQRRRTDDI